MTSKQFYSTFRSRFVTFYKHLIDFFVHLLFLRNLINRTVIKTLLKSYKIKDILRDELQSDFKLPIKKPFDAHFFVTHAAASIEQFPETFGEGVDLWVFSVNIEIIVKLFLILQDRSWRITMGNDTPIHHVIGKVSVAVTALTAAQKVQIFIIRSWDSAVIAIIGWFIKAFWHFYYRCALVKLFFRSARKTDEMIYDEFIKTISPRTKRQVSPNREELCEIRTNFINPQAALNARGNWMYIVNGVDTATQLVKTETCV